MTASHKRYAIQAVIVLALVYFLAQFALDAVFTPPHTLGECPPESFAVTLEKSRPENGNMIFTGSVTNRGPMACGVLLKITTVDKSGAALHAKTFFPADTRNIRPGATEYFTASVRRNAEATDYELAVKNAWVWRE